MRTRERYKDYDPLAWFYNREWGSDYHSQVLPVLDRLVLSELQRGATILDLCCGDGRFCAAMVARGFCVTGLDGSREMLRFAAENAPGVEWLLADARAFHSKPRFDLAISIFESLNHIMTIDDLHAVFLNVFRALRPGGRFVFDLNRESAFQTFWNRKYLIQRADGICRADTYYNDAEKVGYCNLTLEGSGVAIPEISRLTIKQKCHSIMAAKTALESAMFHDIRQFDAADDLGMSGDIALARTFFCAGK
jgi:SAM-dependent methyltransferase